MQTKLEKFLLEAKLIHGDKYDYGKVVEIKNTRTNVVIICKIHGEFNQNAYSHTKGHGCNKCASTSLITSVDEFISKSIDKHGDKYDYSRVVGIKNSSTNVIIICKIHGEFQQKPYSHIRGHGCNKCAKFRSGNLLRKSKEEFISEAIKVHGDKYDYSQVVYVNTKTHVKIICNVHNIFNQSPDKHLQGSGCPSCYGNKKKQLKNLFQKQLKYMEISMTIH